MERLSGLDATFLYLETPTHHMHVAATMVIDPATMPGGYSFEKIKEFIGARVHLVPPFSRRLMEVPFRVHHPIWVEDPDFDLDYHVRRIGAPSPGGRRELGEVAGQVASTPARPLPSAVGAVGGRGPEARPGGHRHEGPPLRHRRRLRRRADGPPLRPRAGRGRSAVHPSARRSASRPTSSCSGTPRVSRVAAQPRAPPAHRLARCSRSAGSSRDAGAPGAPRRRGAAHRAPRTPWNGPLGPRRQVGLARVSLADVKAVKNHFGVTVNDVVLGLGRRHPPPLPREPRRPARRAAARGVPGVGPRRRRHAAAATACRPCSPRSPPTSTIPAARLAGDPRGRRRGAKEEHNAVGADMLQNWAEFAGPNLFNLAARLYSNLDLADSHRPIHNVIISNVPGPDFPLYYAGAELVAAYPMGPVMEGAGLNVTVMSYRGTSTSASWSTRTWCPTCGPWPTPSSRPSPSSWRPVGAEAEQVGDRASRDERRPERRRSR